MPSPVKTLLRYAVSFGLMAAFLYWAFGGIDAAGVWAAASNVSPVWLLAIVATTIVTALLRGWRWVVLLRPVAPQVTVIDATLALAICYSANIAFPRAGEAARALSLKWRRDASVSAVLGTVVVERVIDLLWLVFFLALSVVLVPGRIKSAFPIELSLPGDTVVPFTLRQLTIAAIGFCVLLIGGVLTVYAYGDRGVALVERLIGRVSTRLAGRVGYLLGSFVHGLVAVRSVSAYAEIFISSCLLNLGYIFIIYASYLAFGFDQTPWQLGLAAALVVMAVSSVGVVVPTPGAVGSYHFFFGRALIDLFAVPEAAAMACATLVHALGNLTYLAFGVPALILQRRGRRSQDGSASLAQEMAHVEEEPRGD